MELNAWQTALKNKIDSLTDAELFDEIIEMNKRDQGGPYSIKNWWGYKYAVSEFKRREKEKMEIEERKHKEQDDSLTNEELFNKILDNLHGDDFDGGFTVKGWQRFNNIVIEYAKRMGYKLYNWDG